MADATVTKLSSNPRASYWGRFLVETQWETYQTETMLSRVMRATSGPSLAAWLAGPVDGYFQDEIIDRFAFQGDDKSGNWAPLSDTTNRIRESLGFPAGDPINERTGELLEFVMHSREHLAGDSWAMMQIPGDPDSEELANKLLHAQQGAQDNPRFPGSTTPPRPVLAVDPTDMEILLRMLEMHVMESVAAGL